MDSQRLKDASTVILMRRATRGGFEVLLTRRPQGMGFLGGMYVFPGGVVRKADCSEAILKRCRDVTPGTARKILGELRSPDQSLGFWVAGIRELYEEIGILLCSREDGSAFPVGNPSLRQRLDEKRIALLEGSLDFLEFLESEELRCDVGRLKYFSHWLTPAEFPVRFDTRFYLALAPEDQTPLPVSREVTQSLWISPERSLRLYRKGELPLIFPTFASLRTLANFESIDEVLDDHL